MELILHRGLVIDVFVRVSLVGIEILKIDARIVVASVDAYLRFAEACNRLEIGRKAPAQLTDIVGDTMESGAKGKSKGALSGAAEAVTDSLKGITGRDDSEEEEAEEEDEGKEKEPVERRRRPARRTSRRERE